MRDPRANRAQAFVKAHSTRRQLPMRPGFPPSMPSFEGQLKEKEITGLIEYIKSLK